AERRVRLLVQRVVWQATSGVASVAGVSLLVFGAGAYECASMFANRLTQLQIPATVNLRSAGTHSWPYWADELSRSWPTIAHALDIKT
ncbi:hypothetical protein ACIBG0_42040, partial [Nocardia sp. NPDC050630]